MTLRSRDLRAEGRVVAVIAVIGAPALLHLAGSGTPAPKASAAAVAPSPRDPRRGPAPAEHSAPERAAAVLAREAGVGPYAARIAIGAATIESGEPLAVELAAEFPEGMVAAFPDDSSFGPFEVIRRLPPRREPVRSAPNEPRRVRLTQQLLLRTFLPGAREIPALSFGFAAADAEGEPGTASGSASASPSPGRAPAPDAPASPGPRPDAERVLTPPMAVEVLPLEDAAEAADGWTTPAPLRAPPPAESGRLRWLLGAAVLAACAGATALFLRRRRAVEVDPETWALDALAAIERRGVQQPGTVEPFFIAVTATLHEYLRRRIGLDAPAQTSAEFVHFLREGDRRGGAILGEAQRIDLADLAHLSDIVKFGRHAASPEECGRAIASVRRVIEALRPAPEVDAAAPGVRSGVGGAPGGRAEALAAGAPAHAALGGASAPERSPE
ncbi:MAG TPA: hypothetical protein PKC43_11615 [Phycisphaerales bacterium]|nr:hypothetical protein [Phycisphaerales bacterium]HMP38080.1 hypothetical protein [Phycisphaerales bacterium]